MGFTEARKQTSTCPRFATPGVHRRLEQRVECALQTNPACIHQDAGTVRRNRQLARLFADIAAKPRQYLFAKIATCVLRVLPVNT